MISELGKQILLTLINDKCVVSGLKLSALCNVSINTIRKEILLVNEELEQYGCQIESRTSLGYELVITDATLAEPYLSNTTKKFERFFYLQLGEYNRAYYILRRLLTDYKHLSIDQLADELYCSKSTIIREIPKIKHYIHTFHLELINSRSTGLEIQGDEWDKEMCLLFLEKAFIALPKSEQEKEPWFVKAMLFSLDSEFSWKLQQILITQMQQTPAVQIPRLYQPRIIKFIFMSISRIHLHKEIHFSDKQIDKAKDDIVYPFVRKLIHAFPKYIQDHLDDTSMLALSMLIQTYRDICQESDIPQKEYETYIQEANHIIQFISSRYEIGHLLDDKIYTDIAFYLYTIHRSRLYHIPLDQEILVPFSDDGIFGVELCAEFAKYFYLHKHIHLTHTETAPIYYIFSRVTGAYSKFSFKQKMLVVSSYGINYANSVLAHIYRNHSFYIKEICALPCLPPKEELSQYDVVVTDFDLSKYDLPEDTTFLDFSFLHNPINTQTIQSFVNKIYRKHGLKYFPDSHFIKTNCENKEDLFEIIANTLKDKVENSNDFIKDLHVKESFVVTERSKLLGLLSPFSYSFDTPIFYIFANNKPLLWHQKYVQFLIFFQYGEGHYYELQTINNMIVRIIHSPFNELYAALNQGYDALINSILG